MKRPSRSDVPARLFVDSGAWLAFFSARDRLHADADRLMRAAVEKRIPLLTTNLVIAEVHRLLLFRAGIAAASRAVEILDKSKHLTLRFVDAAGHEAAQAWLKKLGDQPISYTDAASFAVMADSRCTVAFGFDNHFRVAGFSLWQDLA